MVTKNIKKNRKKQIGDNIDAIVWVDRLTLFVFMKLVVLRFRYNFRTIKYASISSLARKLINGPLVSFWNYQYAYDFGSEITSKEEREVILEAHEDISRFIYQHIQPFSTSMDVIKNISPRYDTDQVHHFLELEVAFEIEEIMVLINLFRLAQENDSSQKSYKHNICLVRWSYWLKELRSFYTNLPIRVVSYFNIKESLFYCYTPLKCIFEIFGNLFLLGIGQGIKKDLDKAPKIAVIHVQGTDLSKKTDYFWFLKSGINPKNILMYFKYATRGPDEDAVKHLKSSKINWVNVIPWKFGNKGLMGATAEVNRLPCWIFVKRVCKTFGVGTKMFFQILTKASTKRFFLFKNLLLLRNTVDFFESMFEMHNIKVHFALHEGGRDMTAACIAMDLLGGVDVTTHWSSYDCSQVVMGKCHDVYFSWGPFFKRNYFDKPYYRVKNYVYSGYPYDHFFENCRERASVHREALLAKGVNYVICVYDQNNPVTKPVWNREVENFYKRLVDYLLSDPKLGLILKPKKQSPQVKLPNIKKHIDKALSTGRCVVLGGDVFPNEAAQAADLALGLMVSSTPTVEAALSKTPAITYDPQRNTSHPFYKHGSHKIAFTDLNVLMNAIATFRKDPEKCPGFGDYSPVLKDVDPFQDNQASVRIGKYMGCLLNKFSEGSSKDQAIDAANSWYREDFGDDKIISEKEVTNEELLKV